MKRIIFILHNIAAWDSLSGVYSELTKLPINVDIIALEDEVCNYAKVAAYSKELTTELSKLNLEFKTCSNKQQFKELLDELKPDLIIRQSAWDEDIPMYARTKAIEQYRLCHIPYYTIDCVKNLESKIDKNYDAKVDVEINQRYIVACDLFYCISESQYAKAQQIFEGDKNALRYFGNPRLDYVRKFAGRYDNDTDKLNILYTSHHSVTKSGMRFGVFHKFASQLVALAEKYKDFVNFRYTTHPLLEAAMKSTWPEEYEQFQEVVAKQDNFLLDSNSRYSESFAWSDMLITDGVSILNEYPLIEKPLIFIDSKRHKPFSENGQSAADCAYNVTEIEDIENLIKQAIDKQLKPKYSEIEKYKQHIKLQDNVAYKIANDIFEYVSNT